VSAEAGPGVIFGTLADHAGAIVADIANVLFITSVLAALLSFHNGVSRYLFALGRERVLPRFLGATGARTAAPVAGSLAQSLLAVAVVLAFAITGRHPIFDLFTWLSGVSAVGVVLLMTLTSAAVVGYFKSRGMARRRHRSFDRETVWQRAIAPGIATVLLFMVLVVLVFNFNALLAPDTPAYLRWLLPAITLVAAVVGLMWGVVLKYTRPRVYEGIGRAAVEDLAEPGLHPLPTHPPSHSRTF
jgi:amino acid transporter